MSEPTTKLQVSDPRRLASVQRLGDLTDPYPAQGNDDALFVSAMLEQVRWHSERSDFYRKVIERSGFDPGRVRGLEDLSRLPPIPAPFFKAHELLSIDRKEVFRHFTSSGTTGQKSQVFFDRWSFQAGTRMVDAVFHALGFVTPDQPTNYLLYSYETEADPKLGTAHTDNYLCGFAPVKESFCALRRDGAGGFEFDVFGCIEKLRQYERQGLPIRIFGFPAFLHFTLERLRLLGHRPLKLNPRSLVFLGGGWKGHADQAVPKPALYGAIEELLGIPGVRVRDSFGAVEHPIPYSECEHHRFHVPTWSRVLIRDVRTLQPCGLGRPGFLQFLTPFITSMPAHSIMMGDLATLHPGSDCPCPIQTPFFNVLGRAGTSRNKSCAVAAAELLSGRGGGRH